MTAWTERLLANGDPQPGSILRNKRDKGFITPREQYVKAETPQSIAKIAITWNMAIGTVSGWSVEQGWAAARKRYWAEQERQVINLNQEELNKMRSTTLKRIQTNFEDIEEVVMNMAHNGTKDVFISGKKETVRLGPEDIVRLASALATASKGTMTALGINFNLNEEARVDLEDNQPATGMVFVMPLTEIEASRARLDGLAPGDILPEDYTEAEVVPAKALMPPSEKPS